MAVRHISVLQLLRIKPNAECCDCSREIDGAPESEVWTISNNSLIYCPKCARYEGIGSED